MTNSEVLIFLIEELTQAFASLNRDTTTNPLPWSNDKELFELICAPLKYENDNSQKRKIAKQKIINLFDNAETFDSETFHKLADNIICGEYQEKYTKELLDFLREQAKLLQITIDDKLTSIVAEIPCKSGNEKGYRSNFNHWKNGKTKRISRREVKHRLEQNFYFSSSLWNQGEYTIKQTIREGVALFIKNQTTDTQKIIDIFTTLRKKFQLENDMTENEKLLLNKISTMNKTELMDFIGKNYPLAKHFTQRFIHELVFILYPKRYYRLLLEDIFPALDIDIQDSNEIKKIKAHIYGSSEIGEYEKAFRILSTITTKNDTEKIDIETEAVSNMKRDMLHNSTKSFQEKKEIIQILVEHYKHIFHYNETFHYYPAINLAYLLCIESTFSEDNNHLHHQLSSIHKQCQPSIIKDQKSDSKQNRYYANMTNLEFGIIKGVGAPIAELERFLEFEEKNIPVSELLRTQRQMQFFIDTVNPKSPEEPIITRVYDAIEVIDDFLEFHSELKFA